MAGGSGSFAAGTSAGATHDGAFVWSDSSSPAAFGSTGPNQFLVRATGGVGINTNSPGGAALNVNGAVAAASFTGNGANLTALNAGNLAAGSVSDARLSANVALLGSSQTFTGAKTFSAPLTAGASVRLNDTNVWMRGGGDLNHGLGYYGAGKPFGALSPDGPVLFGFGGGALGSVSGGAHAVVAWTTNAVAINSDAAPAATLDVNGSLRINGGTTFTNLQAGQAQLAGGSSSARTNITITFPKPFTVAPRITATAHNDPGFDVDDTFVVTVRKASTTNCVLNILRVDAATGWLQVLRVDWMAWQ